jgi:hypothetical protein
VTRFVKKWTAVLASAVLACSTLIAIGGTAWAARTRTAQQTSASEPSSAPTLIRVDGFEHRTVHGSAAPNNVANGLAYFDQIDNIDTGVSIDAAVKRSGNSSLKVNEGTGSGKTAVAAFLGIPPVTLLVGAFYFRVVSAPSAVNSFFYAAGIVKSPGFSIDPSGRIAAGIGRDDPAPVVRSGSVADSQWHRVDFRWSTAGTTYTVDWWFDGVPQPSASRAGLSSGQTITDAKLGTSSTNFNLLFWVDDVLLSVTSADYPLRQFAADHEVLPLNVNGDGTHNVAANQFVRGDGSFITNADGNVWQQIDDFIAAPPDTTTFVMQEIAGAGNYTEHTFEDTAETVIWAVDAAVTVGASGTTVNNLIVRIVDANGNRVIDALTGDYSDTALHHRRKLIEDNPTQAKVNGYKVRFGFSTEVTARPGLSAVLLQIAVPEAT